MLSPLTVALPGSLEQNDAPGWRRRRKEAAAEHVQVVEERELEVRSSDDGDPPQPRKRVLDSLEETLVPLLPSRRRGSGYMALGEVKEMLRDRRRAQEGGGDAQNTKS